MINKINTITIVGGGSAGWMTAGTLCKLHPEKEITVIESPSSPIIGVGESTILEIKYWTKILGVSDKDLMKSTDASYKMGIKFTDFYDKNDEGFHYPFVTEPFFSDKRDGAQDWFFKKALYPETDVKDFARTYVPHMALIEKNKMSYNHSKEFDGFVFDRDVAYNFDATKFGIFIRDNVCIPGGVRVINDDVIDVFVNEEGIEYILLSKGERVESDLYIDCTGFKSLLIEKYMNVPFISFEDMLPNNRAWATKIPYKDKEREMESFANSTAIENGWCWNLPLWSRLGAGYVYSDKFVSKEDALDEFKKYLMSEKMVVPRTQEEIEKLEFRDVPFRVGIHEKVWKKNVVAIGLSAGFLEPLESNGLYTVQVFLYYLSKVLQKEKMNQFDVDVFNTACRRAFTNFAEFLAIHYVMTTRTDTDYWKFQQSRTVSEDMTNLVPTESVGFFDLEKRKTYSGIVNLEQGIPWIATGMRFMTLDKMHQQLIEHNNCVDHKEMFDPFIKAQEFNKERWSRAADKELSHYEFLKKYIYNE